MDEPGPTWILMLRDVSHAVRIDGQSRVVASLVLDADTGLARGIAVAETSHAACGEAMHIALTRPAGPLPPQPPGQILCCAGEAADVRAADVLAELAPLPPDAATPTVADSGPIGEAEDIFDSFVGHMAGRRQPEQFPTPADWQLLFSRASGYTRARPWLRWSDTDQLDLIVNVDQAAARYLAVVIGAEGIQRGLVLYPGAVLPDQLRDWAPGRSTRLPTGTLLLWLDPPADVPPEFAGKAIRYGWPPDADLLPVPLIGGPDGPADLDRRAVHHLTLATTAVHAHAQQHALGSSRRRGKTTGQLTLADSHHGGYTVA